MKKCKLKVRITATFMAFVMVFVALPTQAIALSIENLDASELLNEPVVGDSDSTTQEVFILEEDVSKRGQFEKHYLCSDGTYVSATYPEAVHYLDDNQIWQDVDQSLKYDSSTGLYVSQNSDFQVSFSESASSANIARIEKNGYALSWGIQTTMDISAETSAVAYAQFDKIPSETAGELVSPSSNAKAQPVINNVVEYGTPSERLASDDSSYILPNISSQIEYADAFNGQQNISLKYTVYHNKIEEDIIIAEKGDIRSVSMNMNIGALVPVVNDDGSVDLVDSAGEAQFHIGVPYMMDANFEMCYDIQVIAEKTGDICIITYTPDAEWFESSARVFPILLDPSITTADYVSNIEDTYVQENSTTDHSAAQYLYINKTGGNRRKAIVRIKKLPVVDESMPIISAELTLTAHSSPTNSINLRADYYYGELDFDLYDYPVATEDVPITYTTYSYFESGRTTVTFDFSSHIYEMYLDEEFVIGEGCNYYGDFIIGFSNDDDDTYVSPFYSSEYTNPANRPVFTVKYGYTLPAGILDGEVYSFQNYGSELYMSVNGNEPANNSNVYQASNVTQLATTAQKFKLEYVESSGAYLFRSMSSSSGNDKVLDIRRAGGPIYSGRNVQIYSATDPISQEWFIVPVDNSVFRIVPRSNMALALTVYGNHGGTNTGNTSTSEGNIFVQTLNDSNLYQKWYIYYDDDREVNTLKYRSSLETGCYYLTNSSIGKYLHWSGSYANCQRGLLSDIGDNTVKWRIVNLGDGYCTIQRADIPGYYLSASTESTSGVRVYNDSSETIPDRYKWAIGIASGGGVLIQNKSNGNYLYAFSSTANPSSVDTRALYSFSNPGRDKQTWRVVEADDYNEAGPVIDFNDIAIDIDQTATASVDKTPGDLWVSYSDFDYTITSGSQYVTYNASTHEFTGVAPGTATVLATHKTTGLTGIFDIKVNKNAIIIVPGIMGTELVAGPSNSPYARGTKLWSRSLIDDFEAGRLEGLELADRIISLRCDENGASVYSVIPYNNLYGAGNVYETLYNGLSNEYGTQYDVQFFAYDWRLSNANSANSLDIFIQFHNYDKVVLVCHSMGGLVASKYLSLGSTQRNKVSKVIMLGSPLMGTPALPYIWGSEDMSLFPMFDFLGDGEWIDAIAFYYDFIDYFIRNFPSLYEMFPNEKYFDSSYLGKTYLVTSYGEQGDLDITSYDDTQERLSSYLSFYSDELASSAKCFHDSLYSGSSHITELVDSYYIAGCDMKTMEKIKFDMLDWSIYYNTYDGDSLVPTWSATLGGKFSNRTFYVSANHMGLVSKPESLQYIIQLID